MKAHFKTLGWLILFNMVLYFLVNYFVRSESEVCESIHPRNLNIKSKCSIERVMCKSKVIIFYDFWIIFCSCFSWGEWKAMIQACWLRKNRRVLWKLLSRSQEFPLTSIPYIPYLQTQSIILWILRHSTILTQTTMVITFRLKNKCIVDICENTWISNIFQINLYFYDKLNLWFQFSKINLK